MSTGGEWVTESQLRMWQDGKPVFGNDQVSKSGDASRLSEEQP